MKTIVVLGATGGQGGAIINTLLAQRTHKIRAVTRDPNSAKALALSQRGVEVIKGDINDKDSLISAFQNANAIYAVTDFWAPFIGGLSAEDAQALETRQGKDIVDAALQIPTLEHFIWSTLQSTKHKGGDVSVPHFDGKDDVDEYIKSTPLLQKTTFIWVGYYLQNFHWAAVSAAKIIQGGRTTYAHLYPMPFDTPVRFIEHQSDLGPIISAVLAQPEKTLGGKYVLAASGENLTIGEMTKIWAEAAGVQQNYSYIQVTEESFGALHGKIGLEIGSMFKSWEKRGKGSGKVNPLLPKDLGITEMKTIKEYFKSQDWSGTL